MRAGCHKKSVANNNGRDNYNVEDNILLVHQQIPPLPNTNDKNLICSSIPVMVDELKLSNYQPTFVFFLLVQSNCF